MNRADMLGRAIERREPWDMVIIGGGAVGMGVAVDAASRGYEVLLVEQHDFGKGTSSRSTKLVHGGVRYLEQGAISLVMEALKERGLLRQNAPHLVTDLAFVVPNYEWWEAPFYGVGLKVYDLLAGRYGFGASEMLSKEETLARLPTIKTEGLRGGVVYYDGQFDDARLLINLAATAVEQGATILNYTPATALTRDGDGFLDGVVVRDLESGYEFRAAARVVVNATGPLSDTVRRLVHPEAEALIAPSQGIHLVFDGSFLPGRTRHHGSAHRRWPRDVRDSLARSHARRHDRHRNQRRRARAASLRARDRVHSRDRRPLPAATDLAGRRPQRIRGHPSARAIRIGCQHGVALARPHDPHRSIRVVDHYRRQVDDLSPHGRRLRRSCRDARAVAREAVRDAKPQRARLPSPGAQLWRRCRCTAPMRCSFRISSGPIPRSPSRFIHACRSVVPRWCGPRGPRWRARSRTCWRAERGRSSSTLAQRSRCRLRRRGY